MIRFTEHVLPSMVLQLDVQSKQKTSHVTPDMLYSLISNGKSWACYIDDKLVAIGGHTPIWKGRTMVWGLLGEDCGPAMFAMTRRVKKEMAILLVDFSRLEAYTHRHHEEGHRWLKRLGFKHEGIMRRFSGGEDYSMYAKAD